MWGSTRCVYNSCIAASASRRRPPPANRPMSDRFSDDALAYHRFPVPGKIAISATKPLASQHDLSLAYSPGVAAACDAIVADPAQASHLTARSNLVAVVTNGTAVLGLGPIGPLAAKPVMEGKAVLFKKFSGIDVFDIEVDETDPDRFCDIVASLEPTFGGSTSRTSRRRSASRSNRGFANGWRFRCSHDDQHGTAIIVGAAVRNAPRARRQAHRERPARDYGAPVQPRSPASICWLSMGLRRENVVVTDIAGVVYTGRVEQMDPWEGALRGRYRCTHPRRRHRRRGIFFSVSPRRAYSRPSTSSAWRGALSFSRLRIRCRRFFPRSRARRRRDAIIATGRSDYSEPGQQRSVLSVHLPRSARRRSDRYQRADEARVCRRARRAGPPGSRPIS